MRAYRVNFIWFMYVYRTDVAFAIEENKEQPAPVEVGGSLRNQSIGYGLCENF
jgi:hypothetical protein